MKKTFQLATILTAITAPLSALAQGGINMSYLTSYSQDIIRVVNNILVPVLMAIAFIVFLWGVYKYFILGAADEKSRTDGRQFSLWGIIGFVIITALWALVNLIMGTFNLPAGTVAPPPPTFNPGGSATQYNSGSGFGGSGTTYGSGGTYTGGTSGGGSGVTSSAYTDCISSNGVWNGTSCDFYDDNSSGGGGTQSYVTCWDGSNAVDTSSCPPLPDEFGGTCYDDDGNSYPC